MVRDIKFNQYCPFRYGSCKWRDAADPIEILYEWVNSEGLPEPKWTQDHRQVTIGEINYSLDDFGEKDNALETGMQQREGMR